MEIESVRFQSILEARQNFYTRIQNKNEKFEDFFSDLKQLAKFCNFKDLADSLVRDRVVFGLNDAKLRKEIIECGGDPKLDHIVAICGAFEQKGRENQESAEDGDKIEESNFDPLSGDNFGRNTDTSLHIKEETLDVVNKAACNSTEGRLKRDCHDNDTDETDLNAVECCCINLRRKIVSLEKQLKTNELVHQSVPTDDTVLSQNCNFFEITEMENDGYAEPDIADPTELDDEMDSIYSNSLLQPETNDEGEVFKVGNAIITSELLKECYDLPAGTSNDSTFMNHLIRNLWTHDELVDRMASRTSVKIYGDYTLRPCTPQKKCFILNQLRKRVQSERCTEEKEAKRVSMLVVDKQIRNVIGNERKRFPDEANRRKRIRDGKQQKNSLVKRNLMDCLN